MTETTTTTKMRVQKDLFPTENLSRRGLPRYKINPFVNDNLITQLSGQKNVYYTQNTQNTLIDLETGELSPAQLTITKKIRADRETFVKLYTNHLTAFFELTQTANRVLQYVLYLTQETAINKDKIYISLIGTQDFFNSHNSKISSASFYRAMKELVEKLFVAETIEPNWYFINPSLFFNGDRIEFLTQFYVEKDKSEIEKIE